MTDVQALARGVRISPRKAGLVASLVRGRSVADALVILDHTPKKAAPLIKKVVESAKANAVNNHDLKEDSLQISRLTVGRGVALKRYRPIAFGRAHPYQHPTSHIKVILSGQPRAAQPSTKKPAAKAKSSVAKAGKKG